MPESKQEKLISGVLKPLRAKDLLYADHRVMDGAQVAYFMAELRDTLQKLEGFFK